MNVNGITIGTIVIFITLNNQSFKIDIYVVGRRPNTLSNSIMNNGHTNITKSGYSAVIK